MRSATAFAVIAKLAAAGSVSPSTRRVHAENMARAEPFKVMFDRDVNAGASSIATHTSNETLSNP